VTREWSDWRDGWIWWIQSVYVDPPRRRRGVYAALHRHVLEQARLAGDVVGLRLYVDRANRAAQRTYERLGMAPSHYVLYEQGGAPRP
jgi:GNAT superfamily N-acetyltransferase